MELERELSELQHENSQLRQQLDMSVDDSVSQQVVALESQNTALRTQLEEAEGAQDRLAALADKHQERISELWSEVITVREELSSATQDKEMLSKQIAGLQESERLAFAEAQQYKGEIAQLQEEHLKLIQSKDELQNKYEELKAEHVKLMGHHNPKQKIKHIIAIKKENNQLREQKHQVEDLLSSRELQLKRLEQELRRNKIPIPKEIQNPSFKDIQNVQGHSITQENSLL
jgi:chromosome segregation ATPase